MECGPASDRPDCCSGVPLAKKSCFGTNYIGTLYARGMLIARIDGYDGTVIPATNKHNTD